MINLAFGFKFPHLCLLVSENHVVTHSHHLCQNLCVSAPFSKLTDQGPVRRSKTSPTASVRAQIPDSANKRYDEEIFRNYTQVL